MGNTLEIAFGASKFILLNPRLIIINSLEFS